MGEPLDQGHHPVVLRRRRHRDPGAVFCEDSLQKAEPAASPRGAQDDVLAGHGRDIRSEEGMAADHLRPGCGEHLPDRLFLQRCQIHQEGLFRKKRSHLADDVDRGRDRDGHDDDPAGRRELRDGASPPSFPTRGPCGPAR